MASTGTEKATMGSEWQPIATEPNDGDFRLYGLHVSHRSGHQWFEVHYLAWEDGGDMIDPAGDTFSDWCHSDFEFWAPAPKMPVSVCAEEGTTK
jgi:hypothetical protein